MSINSWLTSKGLTLLGVVVALVLLISCGSDGSISAHSPLSILGVWGGEGIRMTIEHEGAVIQYDCGEGSIDEAIIPYVQGRFQAEGTFTPGGGPDPEGGRPRQATFYRGIIHGDSMKLTVTLIDTAQPLRSYNLMFGDNGHLRLCY